MTASLSGRVVAILGPGSEQERALAVACAEAGADIALGTLTRTQDEEFASASIANEVWALGREQLVRVLDASRLAEVEGFAADVLSELGRCDALILLRGSHLEVAAWFARAIEPGHAAVIVLPRPDSDESELARLESEIRALNESGHGPNARMFTGLVGDLLAALPRS